MITYPIYPRPIPNYRFINNLWGTASDSDLTYTRPRSRTSRSLSFTEAWGRDRRRHVRALFYHPSDHTLPRETQRTDPLGQRPQESTYSRAYHLQNFHDKGYETSTIPTNNEPFGHSHRRKQHFVKGVVPGGSGANKMIYGTEEMLRLSEEKKKQSQAGKPLGFLYGTEAATQVGKQKPSTRPNNALWLEAREHDDPVTRNKKRASDQDDFLEKHWQEKQRQAIELQKEKKRDLEMLRSFEPWGRPGGGAPIKPADTGNAATKRTKAVAALKEEEYSPFGRGGGGAPNRTESGKQLTQLRGDPELRFPTYGQSSDVVPSLRYRKNMEYGKDLDNFIDTLRAKKEFQRRQSFELELEHNKYDPYGKPGNGAPIKNDKGEVKAYYPTTLSGNIEELRSKEPRHPHAYNNVQHTQQENTLWQEERYDPWGKGCGTVERNSAGKIIKAPKPKSDDTDGIGIPVGRPGAGAPITDDKGKLVTRKPQTLTKNNYGQVMSRDFSPKNRHGSVYDPFGKPGAGAPIRGSDGKLKTHLVAQVEHDGMESSLNSSFNNLHAKQAYLKTLQDLKEQADNKRKVENDELRKSGGDVASWIKGGEVGQPKFDPVTNEIIASHRNTSDVTQHKLNIRRQKNETSNAYHNELKDLVDAKQHQRIQERETEKHDAIKHVDTMDRQWGRPGAGAPLYGGEMRKQRVGLTPADEMTFRLA